MERRINVHTLMLSLQPIELTLIDRWFRKITTDNPLNASVDEDAIMIQLWQHISDEVVL